MFCSSISLSQRFGRWSQPCKKHVRINMHIMTRVSLSKLNFIYSLSLLLMSLEYLISFVEHMIPCEILVCITPLGKYMRINRSKDAHNSCQQCREWVVLKQNLHNSSSKYTIVRLPCFQMAQKIHLDRLRL